MSLSHDASVSDDIATDHASINCSRVGNAVSIIKNLGYGCFLAKADIKSAFRTLPIRPADSDVLGICMCSMF